MGGSSCNGSAAARDVVSAPRWHLSADGQVALVGVDNARPDGAAFVYTSPS